MTIREATLDDVPRLVDMGQRFLQASSYRTVIANNPQAMGVMASWLITSADGVIFVAELGTMVGMIGLVIQPHYLSGQMTANEVFWWVEPETRGTIGLKLLRRAERWAMVHGAERMQMVAPDAAVGKIYERFGYSQMEIGYQRSLA